MSTPRLLVFATGSGGEGGGSGFEKLVEASRTGFLMADIVGVVSNYLDGGVRKRADRLNIPFFHFPKPRMADGYQRLAEETQADFFALSGWLCIVKGLDPKTRFNSGTVFNIHPGPLPRFGGEGFYGHHVHEAVMEAFRKGEVTHSAVTMHFVTDLYDEGPTFFKMEVPIDGEDTPVTLAQKVNAVEHRFQPLLTSLVVTGKVRWSGKRGDPIVYSSGYPPHWKG